MCNLNILITKKGSFKNYSQLIDRLSTLSYDSNSDADGVYFSGTDKIYKSSDKLNYLKYAKGFDSSKFVISHQRISTSGLSEDNHQPFMNDEFAIAHNGIFYGYGTDKESDTKQVFAFFNKEFKKVCIDNPDEKREAQVLKTMKKVFEAMTGSYSVFIYDKKQDLGYYIKNDYTSIHLYGAKNYMYLSTRSTGEWHGKCKVMNVLPDHVYRVGVIKGKFEFKSILEIEDSYSGYSNYSYNAGTRGYNTTTLKKKTFKPDLTAPFEAYCDHCGMFEMVKERPRFKNYHLCKNCNTDMRREAFDSPDDFNLENYGDFKQYQVNKDKKDKNKLNHYDVIGYEEGVGFSSHQCQKDIDYPREGDISNVEEEFYKMELGEFSRDIHGVYYL